jgi:hypothetical protein
VLGTRTSQRVIDQLKIQKTVRVAACYQFKDADVTFCGSAQSKSSPISARSVFYNKPMTGRVYSGLLGGCSSAFGDYESDVVLLFAMAEALHFLDDRTDRVPGLQVTIFAQGFE